MENCRRRLGTAWLPLLTILAVEAPQAQAESYPNKPVTIISDAAAGSTPDVDARFVAEGLGRRWHQQVIVVNRPGANGSLAARAAAEAAPDGYTLYMPVLSTFVSPPGVEANIPIEVPRDFAAIGFTAENRMLIAASPSLGVKTLRELVALPK